MSRRIEILALTLGDALASVVALSAAVWGPAALSWLPPVVGSVSIASAVLVAAWVLLFAFSGLYAERYARGRLDELVTLAKVVAFGCLALLFGVVIDRVQGGDVRTAIGSYALSQFVAVGGVRLMLRAVQRALVVRGYGRHRAVVVGWSDRVEPLYHDLARYPAANIEIVGALRLRAPSDVPVLADGTPAPVTITERFPGGDALPDGAIEMTAAGAPEAAVAELPGLIDRLGVQDVIIAIGSEDHATLDEVLRVCDGKAVTLKLVPDFYAAVGGMARTEHTYGLPLIEVLPEPMPAWERRTKRIADVVVSALVLLIGAPIWLAVAGLVRATSPGPAIYRQTRVGRLGKPFTMLKFRTMVDDAERHTGPVWAEKRDDRVTPIGRWLRRLRIDEIPQMWNVFVGQMSLVGPRPERPYFVDKLVDRIPLYSRRHRIQPGVTGLAQVKWRYDSDLDDVRQKLKYDLFYIETMSLGLDTKILFRTIRTALAGGGH
ncbi:sugar transferase [Rubrivirga sp. IMCC43871]|uniref:sugar transferase n=1 Tax=Rubrivirga sp. IMCC43871 TaxID=3391575 RepID=UPI00398F9F4B